MKPSAWQLIASYINHRAANSGNISTLNPVCTTSNPGRNMNGRCPVNLPKPNLDNSRPRHPRASLHNICNELGCQLEPPNWALCPASVSRPTSSDYCCQRISILPTLPRQKKKKPAPKVGSLAPAAPTACLPTRLSGKSASPCRQAGSYCGTSLVTRGTRRPARGPTRGAESPIPGKDSCRTRKAPPTGAARDDTESSPILNPLALSPLGDIRPS